MSYIRNLILYATLIFVGISASNASAEADDFNLDFDDPANGESEVDPENIIEMKVQIENVVDQPMSFEMKILNDDDLQSTHENYIMYKEMLNECKSLLQSQRDTLNEMDGILTPNE